MAEVDVRLVREYLELNGFLVQGLRKYVVSKKQTDEQPAADLLAYNPRRVGKSSLSFVLTTSDLRGLERAAFSVRGWHTERFSPSLLASSPGLFDFVRPKSVAVLREIFGDKPVQKVLVVSGLPSGRAVRTRSIEQLKEKGVDHVLEMATVLECVARAVRTNRNYAGSDLLQLLRLIRCYELLQSRQLELFGKKARRK